MNRMTNKFHTGIRDIEEDKKDLDELKELYAKAVDNNLTKFKFRNTEVLTTYAKYLIEYLEKTKKL